MAVFFYANIRVLCYNMACYINSANAILYSIFIIRKFIMPGLFKNVDCIELYVSDLDDGINYYCGIMGLELLWRADTTAGLGMESGIAEIVLQTDRTWMSVDFLVESVSGSVEKITDSGGKLIYGPFDIPIGKCAVVQDKWDNEYVILDMSKGRYVTDEKKNVIGVSKGA